MDTLIHHGMQFNACTIPTEHGCVLLILAPRGMLGCGYFAVETADRIGDALAIVSGVKNYDDMLHSEVKKVSAAAAQRGVKIGMTGGEALLKMI